MKFKLNMLLISNMFFTKHIRPRFYYIDVIEIWIMLKYFKCYESKFKVI